MTPTMTVIHMKKNVTFELDTNQGEGIKDKLKFVAKRLSNRIQLHTSLGSDEYSELPTMSQHDQTLVNQSFEFPSPPQATMSFQTNSQRQCPILYPKDKCA